MHHIYMDVNIYNLSLQSGKSKQVDKLKQQLIFFFTNQQFTICTIIFKHYHHSQLSKLRHLVLSDYNYY